MVLADMRNTTRMSFGALEAELLTSEIGTAAAMFESGGHFEAHAWNRMAGFIVLSSNKK